MLISFALVFYVFKKYLQRQHGPFPLFKIQFQFGKLLICIDLCQHGLSLPDLHKSSGIVSFSNPLNLSCFDDPAVEVAEDEADKEALERQEGSFNYVEDLRNENVNCGNFSLPDCG